MNKFSDELFSDLHKDTYGFRPSQDTYKAWNAMSAEEKQDYWDRMISDMKDDDLMYSDEYAEFIMEHSRGDRVICNGDTLLEAMEDGYMFEEFLRSR